MPVSGYSTNLPSDVILDQGIVRIGSANLGVTKGPPRWDPGWEIQNIEFDGKHAPLYLLDRKFYGECVLAFTLIEFGPSTTGNQIPKLEAGAAAVDSGTTPNTKTTITPKVGGSLYPAGDYLGDVRVIFQRGLAPAAGAKTFAAITMAKALVRKWSVNGSNKDTATIDVEIVGRRDASTLTIWDAPYIIELLETLP